MSFLSGLAKIGSTIGKIGNFIPGVNLVSSALDLASGAWKQDRTQAINLENSALQFARNKEMYQNRYQWQMEDMKKAGLNPLLAYSQAAPGGPSVSLPGAPAFDAPAISTTAKNYAETMKTEEETRKTFEETRHTKKKILTEIQKVKNMRAQKRLINKQEIQALTQTGVLLNQHEKITQEILKIGAETEETRAKTQQLKVNAERLETMMAKLKQQSGLYGTAYGMILTYIRETLGAIGALISGVPANLVK